MELLIIRHGESENNRLHATTGSYDGRLSDPELTKLGVAQTKALALAMCSGLQPRPDVLYSSLMLRAVQTARILADGIDLDVHGHLEAYECGGPYQGLPHDPMPSPGLPASELLRHNPRLILPDGVDETGWYRGEGEDYAERAERGRRLVAELVERYDGTDTLVGIVCHEMMSQHLVRAALGFDTPEGLTEPWLSLDNTGTTLISMDAPVPVTETQHNGGDTERVLEWANNRVHLRPDQVTG